MMGPGDVIATSAPGKLFLLGEYAVLEGAPAILCAVDRRARVQIRAGAGGHWSISAPNLEIHDQPLAADGGLPVSVDEALRQRLAVFDAVRATVADALDSPLPALAVHIDTGEFARDGHKLGLGSSAAVAAALTLGLLSVVETSPAISRIQTLAIAAHRRAQNGAGSGGDVAVAVHGGLISYIRDLPPRPLDWPPGLIGKAVVTGEGASTPALIERVYAYRANEPEGFASDMTRLTRLAELSCERLGQSGHFLQVAREYFEALIALDHHARAGIVSARHHELAGLAARRGAVFKSSGAGGGDVGLLFSRRADDTPALISAFGEAGADVLDLVFGAPGVRLDNA